MTKEEATLIFLMEQIGAYKAPVLFWSGGKDSTALLHLMWSHGIRMPVVYYRDPWFPRKNRFINSVIDAYLLECHEYPPLRVSLKHSPQMVGLVSEYSTGPSSVAAVLKNTIEYHDEADEKEFLCGVIFLMRPCATFAFPWDVAFVGHRNDDKDPIFGPIPLHSSVVLSRRRARLRVPIEGLERVGCLGLHRALRRADSIRSV